MVLIRRQEPNKHAINKTSIAKITAAALSLFTILRLLVTFRRQQEEKDPVVSLTRKGLQPSDLYPISKDEVSRASPQMMLDQCFTLRASATATNSSATTAQSASHYRIGLEVIEHPLHFTSHTRKGFHMFHFVEFLVMAFWKISNLEEENQHPLELAWIYGPLYELMDLKGPHHINVQITDLIFGNGTKFFGMDVNDAKMDKINKLWWNDAASKRWSKWFHRLLFGKWQTWFRPDAKMAREELLETASSILLITRNKCDHGSINKMWFSCIDSFPAMKWHASIQQNLKRIIKTSSLNDEQTRKPVVSYIDRQRTGRRLPAVDHNWLLSYLQNHPDIDFQHLFMEDYDAKEQIRLAAQSDVIMGVHGNGLTHLLWMAPHSHVVEMFWEYPFQYDYATAAQLLRHNYVAIFNGHVLNNSLAEKRNPGLTKLPHKLSRKDAGHFSEMTRDQIRWTVKDAIAQFAKQKTSQ